MCIALRRMWVPQRGEYVDVPCRECWQCIENRVNDWVGRCIAESKTTVGGTLAMTLTYGRDEEGREDHPRAKVLTYSDVQKFLKLLRYHGYPARYFSVGEYGSEKGRSHWHIVLFFVDRMPPLVGVDEYARAVVEGREVERFMWHRLDEKGQVVIVDRKPALWWKHGLIHVEDVTYGSVRYNTKYICKGIGEDERQGHLMPSKKPPLGTAYFRQLAERYVAAGLPLKGLGYSFDECRDEDGNLVEFWLHGKAAEDYVEHYIETWWKRRAEGVKPYYKRDYPPRWLPKSPFLEAWMDKRAAAELETLRDEALWKERRETSDKRAAEAKRLAAEEDARRAADRATWSPERQDEWDEFNFGLKLDREFENGKWVKRWRNVKGPDGGQSSGAA